MFKFCFVLLSLIAATANGAPLTQIISARGGPCNPLGPSMASFNSLLAGAAPCNQQNQADHMIDFAKNKGKHPSQHPNNGPSAPVRHHPRSTSGDFHLQNGREAQRLNANFAHLTSHSHCTDGQTACVGSSLAHCVHGSFVTSHCSSGMICAAIPLVNSPGTSLTCTTRADAVARIAATGATGGLTG